MRILFLSQVLPYPPDAGPRVKTWNVLRFLVERGHDVSLACFLRAEEIPHLREVERVCEQVVTVPMKRSRFADTAYWLRSRLTGRPFLVERDGLRRMQTSVDALLRNGVFDVLHADQLPMTQFALAHSHQDQAPARIFDAHNATWVILRQMIQGAPALLRPAIAVETRSVRRYEGRAVRSFDRTLAVSQEDRLKLLEAANDENANESIDASRVEVVPISIDTERLQPVPKADGAQLILAIGSMHYAPNAEGIRWFLRQVLPLVQRQLPGARVRVVGKNPPSDFLAMQNDSAGAIEVAGYLPSLTPSFEQAAVLVVPVLSGSGMRVRILEGLARGLPIVTTSVGVEGIKARHEQELLIADTPEAFAAAVCRLLNQKDLRWRLAEAGRALAVSRYDYRVALAGLESIYTDARRIRMRRAPSQVSVAHSH